MGESIELKLTDGQVRDAIGGALINLLTPERRDEILKHAVAQLLAPTKDSYGHAQPSPMSIIVADAVEKVARQVAKEWLDTQPDFRAKVEALLRDAVERTLVGDGREKIVNTMAEALRKTIAGDRY